MDISGTRSRHIKRNVWSVECRCAYTGWVDLNGDILKHLFHLSLHERNYSRRKNYTI